jgi:hypothetical protein
MRSEECGFNRFVQRALYKLSGQKVIGFLISTAAIVVIIALSHCWRNVPDEIYLKGMGYIKTLALALLGSKMAQNVIGMVSGKGNNNDNGGR